MEKEKLAEFLRESRSAYDVFQKKADILSIVSDGLKIKLESITSIPDFYAHKQMILNELDEEKPKKRGK